MLVVHLGQVEAIRESRGRMTNHLSIATRVAYCCAPSLGRSELNTSVGHATDDGTDARKVLVLGTFLGDDQVWPAVSGANGQVEGRASLRYTAVAAYRPRDRP